VSGLKVTGAIINIR